MKPLSRKTPRMFAVNFEKRPGDLGVTAIVLADAPETALEKVFIMFRRHGQASRVATVFEIIFAEMDWDTGRNFMVRVKKRPDRLLMMMTGDPRLWPTLRDWREGSVYEFHVETGKASRWRDSDGGHPTQGASAEASGPFQLPLFSDGGCPAPPGRAI